MQVRVSASTGECKCRRGQMSANAGVCVYELVIALKQDKTMREMYELSEVMHFDIMQYFLML